MSQTPIVLVTICDGIGITRRFKKSTWAPYLFATLIKNGYSSIINSRIIICKSDERCAIIYKNMKLHFQKKKKFWSMKT